MDRSGIAGGLFGIIFQCCGRFEDYSLTTKRRFKDASKTFQIRFKDVSDTLLSRLEKA